MQKKQRLTDSRILENDKLKEIYERKKKELDLTQHKLAEKFEVSQTAIAQYLNGINPLNAKAALQFAEALDVAVSEFSPRLEKEINSFVESAAQVNNTINQNNNGSGVQNNINQIHNYAANLSHTHTMPDNSMKPVIPKGSEIWVNNSQDLENEKTYLLNWRGLVMVRRLFLAPDNQIILKAWNNQDYPEQIVSKQDIEIIGRVTRWNVED